MKQLSTKQFAFIIFSIITASKLFMLPALLVRSAGRDAYLSAALFLAIEMVILILIMLSVKKTGDNLYTLLDKGATKVGGRIIAALTLPALTVKALLLLTELKVFFNSVLGQNLPDWLIGASACLLLFYIGIKTLRGIGRMSEILTPIVLAATAVLIALAAGGISPKLLKPFAENGFKPVFKNVLNFPFWFADLSVTAVFAGQVKIEKHYYKWGLIAAGLGVVAVLFFCVAASAAYGDVPRLLSFFNTTDLLMYSPSGYVHGRFDLPVFCLRALASFVQLSVIFYCITRHIGYIVKSRNRKSDVIISGVCAAVIFVLISIVFNNGNDLLDFSGGFMRIFAVISGIALPVFVFAATRRKKKNEA